MWLRRGILIFAFLGIQICSAQNISRRSFPKGFVFGTASSAFQYEGAVKEGGRGLTIWDTYAHTKGKIVDSSNADVADNQYHLYSEDVRLMKDMGMNAYRFSIAWSRIYPDGTGKINQAGIDYYNNLINALIANGIEPYVTLYHWDLPLSLQDKYLGWLHPLSMKIYRDKKLIVESGNVQYYESRKDFATYADTCFKSFGDRVKYWITFNEPHTFIIQGYDMGISAPNRCSVFLRANCSAGNSATEPYIVGHHVLLSHATVVDIYKKRYQPKQRGSIGITLDSFWYESATKSSDDIQATQRALDFNLGWFLDPIIIGDYPRSMRTRVGSRLPRFSKIQSSLVKGSFDFIGINHYTTWYASKANIKGQPKDSISDPGANINPLKNGKTIGERARSTWLYIVPYGMRSLMNYIRQKYGNPPVIITENGMDDDFVSFKDALNDEKRIKYHNDYLNNLLAAIKDGCNVKGYFAWSLLDNWEWGAGFSCRFGLYYVDYNDKMLKRYAKDSAKWFKNFLAS